MQCPVDGTTLVISDRNNIEIDYCPTCRGVWLDRGELDKIIEGSMRQTSYTPQSHMQSNSHDSHHSDDDRRGHMNQNKRQERGGFLGDIFGGFGD